MKTQKILYQIISFRYASEGIRFFFASEVKAWIHLLALAAVCMAGGMLHIEKIDWICISIAAGIVFITEVVNTVVEKLIDLVHPEYSRQVKHVKDMMAGAVLMASVLAVIIGILVFYPYIFNLL